MRAGNAHGWSDWRNSPSIAPLTPPATPGSITVTRADGSLTASWDAVDGADRYHVTYSSTNQESWTAAPCDTNCPDASVTFNVSNTKTYFVGVRAGNAYGWSGWRNSSPSAPYSTPPQPPAAVAAVHVTRVCDYILNTSWTPSAGATGYDLNYSDDNRKSWARILTDASHNAWKLYNWSKNKTYRFAVRARNGGGTSDWTESAAAPPPPCKVGNLRATTSAVHGQAGGSITATWDAGKRASAYNVNHRRDGGEWERVKSNHSDTSHTWSVTQSGSYLVAVQSVKDGGLSEWQNADVAWLTADGIAGTAATLTITGHSAQWWYKATAAPDNTCKGPVSATTQNLTGLSVSNSYTYTAYTDSGCANAIGSATFTTGGVSVSNLSETSDGNGLNVLLADLEANAFTTGDHSSGYTLERVVIKFRTPPYDKGKTGGVFTAAIHTESGGNPADSATYTLNGSSAPATAGDYTYTCSGTCSLDKDKTYFLVLSSTSPSYSVGYYRVDATGSANETNTPSDAGWEIANRAKYKSDNTWTDEPGTAASIMFEVIATEKPVLGVSGVTTSGATLTITGHSAQWWYSANKGPHTTCQGPVAAGTSSRSLTGLTAGTSYTYSAYSDTACATVIATAAEFTAGSVSVSNLSEASDGYGIDITMVNNEATGFTTGEHSSGYTLDRVVIKFRTPPNNSAQNAGVLTAAIHAASGGDPAATATYTLSGSSAPATAGDYTYTCPGTCSLDKDTTYFLVLSGTSPSKTVGYYRWDTTESASETNTPSDAGWSIADKSKYKRDGTWNDEALSFSGMFEIFATAKP